MQQVFAVVNIERVGTDNLEQQTLVGADPLVELDNDKPTVLALREISENKIDRSVLDEEVVPQDDIEAMFEGELQQQVAVVPDEDQPGNV